MTIRIVDIDSISPSTYNPRIADPRRLDIIELSLKKLGFILPIYCDSTGEILSGHQRHYVAKRMGVKRVPVDFLENEIDLETRKAINIAFNRGTNDLSQADTPTDLTSALAHKNIAEISAKIPDKDFLSDDFFQCVNTETIKTDLMIVVNSGHWVNYCRNMAGMLSKKGVNMPIVATRSLKVVNGIGRLQYLAECKAKTVEVVFISDDQAEFADMMLNYLSMDFDIHNRYRDLLRFNSFRRARRSIADLGRGFVFPIIGNKKANTFNFELPENVIRWKKQFGLNVVDFGAGHLTETMLLRSKGIRVTPFEPYRLHDNEGDTIDKAESLKVCREFLSDVAAGVQYSSVFISSVLNSVPFAEDRTHIACICAALCGKNTALYAVASSVKQVGWGQVLGIKYLCEKQVKLRTFKLDYEPGIAIGDFSSKPKVQKYHTQEEFYALFKEFFAVVSCREAEKNAQAICVNALPVIPERLRAAIEFEFDLPYPDGSKMGLVNEAIQAFKKRGVL